MPSRYLLPRIAIVEHRLNSRGAFSAALCGILLVGCSGSHTSVKGVISSGTYDFVLFEIATAS